MSRVSEARQQSRIRISTLEGQMYRLLDAQVKANPDYTNEEITMALLNIATRQVGHLWKGQFDSEEDE